MKVKKSEVVIEGEVLQGQEPKVSTSKDQEQKPETAIQGKAPEWMANVEDIGTAMMQSAQEFLLVIEDALIRHHGWKEEEIKKLHEEITPVLQGVAEYEKHGLSLLSPASIEIVAEIAQARLVKEQAWRKGEDTPILAGADSFLLKQAEKNGDLPKKKRKKK